MKKVLGIIAIAVLVFLGLYKAPQRSELISQTIKEIKKLNPVHFQNKDTALPEHLASDLKKFDQLMADLDVIKADYEKRLTEYKKLDSEFTKLVMKSREVPNTELVKQKEAELEEQFLALQESLKSYQEKSQELYKFQSASL